MLASLTHFILCYFSFCRTCHHLIFSCIPWFDRFTCRNTFLVFDLDSAILPASSWERCWIRSLLPMLAHRTKAVPSTTRTAVLCPTVRLLISSLTHAAQIYPWFTETMDFSKGNACSPHYCGLDISVSLTGRGNMPHIYTLHTEHYKHHYEVHSQLPKIK